MGAVRVEYMVRGSGPRGVARGELFYVAGADRMRAVRRRAAGASRSGRTTGAVPQMRPFGDDPGRGVARRDVACRDATADRGAAADCRSTAHGHAAAVRRA